MIVRKIWPIVLPFCIFAALYSFASAVHISYAPESQLVPSLKEIFTAGHRSLFSENGTILEDTYHSLKRLTLALILSSILSLSIVLAHRRGEILSKLFAGPILALAFLPSLAIVPLLLIWLGVGEITKLTVLCLTAAPVMTLMLFDHLGDALKPTEGLRRSLCLPAWQEAFLIELPLLLLALPNAIKNILGSLWLALLAVESLGSTFGLGYRIFLIRRFLQMDVILFYLIWILLLSAVINMTLQKLDQK